jgi:predicted enzyme related to lactoylglutathione lyase
MHTADEPKTVTLTLVTDELSRWREHLSNRSVPMRVPFGATPARENNSFVAVDPEGYFLRFERFNPHPNHDSFVAAFAAATPLDSGVAHASGRLSIRAAAFSVYVESVDEIRTFYEALFDVVPAGQIDGVDAYQMSGSGFLLLVEGSDGLHQATDKSGVTYSFFTSDVDAWYARAAGSTGFELRTPEVLDEDGMVRVFVGYDPVGTFLEWDTFQDVPENEALFRYLP